MYPRYTSSFPWSLGRSLDLPCIPLCYHASFMSLTVARWFCAAKCSSFPNQFMSIILYWKGKEHHNYRKRTTCMHRNRKPCNSFFMVNLASRMDRGRWCAPNDENKNKRATSHKMMAVLQLIRSHAALVYSLHVWYWTCMLRSNDTCQKRDPLTSAAWLYCGFKVWAY